MELDPVDRIVADAVGEPGSRTFYLQASKGEDELTVLLEKEQVRLLAASVMEILQRIGVETDPAAIDPASLALNEPVLEDWRAGRLSIGYQEERDLMVLDLEEVSPGLDDDEDDEGEDDHADEGDEGGEGGDAPVIDPVAAAESLLREQDDAPEEARLWATREQMLAMARRAADVVAAGRPTCQFCGHPMDPEGHWCPATNGHREIGSV